MFRNIRTGIAAPLGAAILLCLSAGTADAHDTRHVLIDTEGAVGVELFYTDTTPMAFANVQLFSPADPGQPFVFSRTDENGRLVFLPDVSGVWRLVAEGSEGHVHNAEIEVGAVAQVLSGRSSGWQRLVLWASLALNLFLLARLFTRDRRPGKGVRQSST